MFATVILPALCCGSVWWRQDEALTDTQDVWITRTNHGASCVTPAALRHNSAGGLRVLNGVTHSGWWGRGDVDSSFSTQFQFLKRVDTVVKCVRSVCGVCAMADGGGDDAAGGDGSGSGSESSVLSCRTPR